MPGGLHRESTEERVPFGDSQALDETLDGERIRCHERLDFGAIRNGENQKAGSVRRADQGTGCP